MRLIAGTDNGSVQPGGEAGDPLNASRVLIDTDKSQDIV